MKKTLLALLLILLTIPFYAQWDSQISGTSANLNDVYCLTPDIVVIAGDGGTILKTIDGGAHWIQKNSGTTNNLRKIQFANATVGYAVGAQGTLLKSIDGGETWSAIPTGFTTDLYGLSVVTANILYISGDHGSIKKSIDGGLTFTDRSYSTVLPFGRIQFLNEQVGYASNYVASPYNDGPTTADKFIKTIDGGITWSLLPLQGVSCFYFLATNIGIICGEGGGIAKTTDAGLTYTSMGSTYRSALDVFPTSENVAWTVDNTFSLCGCTSFCIDKTDLTVAPELQHVNDCFAQNLGEFPFMSIHFSNETTGYAVGWGGSLKKNSTGINTDHPASTTQFTKKDFVKIYPNPASNQFTISFLEKKPSPFSIEITDFLGNKIIAKSYENQYDTTVGIESLSNGIYFVKLQSNSGTSIQKLIKE